MRLVRYQTQDRRPRLGLLENGQIYDLEATSAGRAAAGDMRALLSQGAGVIDEVASAARAGQPVAEDSVSLLAPIANPGKLIAVAGGSYEHDGAEPRGADALPPLFVTSNDDSKGPGDTI